MKSRVFSRGGSAPSFFVAYENRNLQCKRRKNRNRGVAGGDFWSCLEAGFGQAGL